MNTVAKNQNSGRDIRFVLTEPISAVVTVESEDHRLDDEHYAAELVDLSQSGVKLNVPQEIRSDRLIRLKVTIKELGMEFYVAGSVCWCRPSLDGAWLVGCSLRPGFPPRLLERLAAFGHSDQRGGEQGLSGAELLVCSEDGEDWEPAQVQKFARGGVCILSDRTRNLGERLSFKINQLRLSSRVQWQLSVGENYVIGCSFSNERDGNTLEEAFCNANAVPAH